MADQLLYYNLGAFSIYRFVATKVEGDRIAAEINRRQAANGASELKVWTMPIEPTTFEKYFAPVPPTEHGVHEKPELTVHSEEPDA